jgi:hypothetical protein
MLILILHHAIYVFADVCLSTASQEVIDFWQKLPQATVDSNGFLNLVPGTYFIGDANLGSKLYVRDCYNGLTDHTHGIRAKRIRRIVITGTQGIGKTCYALYWLYLLCKENKPVIYQHAVNYYYFSSYGVIKGLFENFYRAGYFDDGDVWFLCGPNEKPYESCLGITLVFIEPDYQRYKQFLKAHATLCLMPIWSIDELELVRANMYPALSVEQVQQLHLRWGGIPRYVLQYANFPQHQALLDKAIAKCLTAGVSAVINNTSYFYSNTSFPSEKVMHMITSDFESKQLVWASEYVFEKFVQENGSELHEQAKRFNNQL